MKILVGMPSKDSWGGPISSEPPFVAALRGAGHDVTEEDYVYGDKEKPTPILERIKRVWKTAFRFRKLLKENEFDIIHLNSAFDLRTILRDSFSLFVMKPGNTKVFFKFHGSECPQFFSTNFGVRFLIGYLKLKIDGFGVFTTEEISDFERLGFKRQKIFQIKNAIDLPPKTSNWTREYTEPDGFFQLLFVSRFVPKKGLIETIDAAAILLESGLSFRLLCVGDGELRSEAEKRISNLGLSKHVEFTGYISEDEVTSHFQRSDILVFPTRFGEGFPIVFFKALAAGMPIVSTRFRAATDYLDGENNCLFCHPEPEDIANKISKLINAPDLRRTMSSNNLELGKTFSKENIASEFTDVYQKIIER